MPEDSAPRYTPSATTKAGTLADLCAALKTNYLNFAFMQEGQEFAVKVRRLSSGEVDLADGFVRDIVPPVKLKYLEKDAGGKLVHDFDHPSPELRAIIEGVAQEHGLSFGLAAMNERFDYSDKDYLKQRNEAQEKQAATVLHLACEGGLADKDESKDADLVQAMKAKLPDTVIKLIVSYVIAISSRGTIEKASFF